MEATVLESLRGISSYPIPLRTLDETAERRGVKLTDAATQKVLNSRGYNLCKADLLLWLALAPNVTQGGQSYSFTDEQRMRFRNAAKALYKEFKDEEAVQASTIYGYKGHRL